MTNEHEKDQKALRFLTCGHVDDGKSTLIGRLLYAMNAVPDDQIAGATTNGVIDYSRFTDGLEDERSQGITIDVAYRYFRDNGRSYRIADTPGHLQYTRNMAVAAVDSDCAFLLVDAKNGVRDQTIRHSKIAAFFGVKHFVVVVNKMDLVDYNKQVFDGIVTNYKENLSHLKDISFTFIPVSALAGDNVSEKSTNMTWYTGDTIRSFLETFNPRPESTSDAVRFPIQYVTRITETTRGYLGMLSGAGVKVGDKLHVVGTPLNVTVKALYHSGTQVDAVLPGQSVCISVVEDVDLSRGQVLSAIDKPVQMTDQLNAGVLWLQPDDAGMENFQGLLKVHHSEVLAQVIVEKFDGPIGFSEVVTAHPIYFDDYTLTPRMGLFILIEPETEKVVGVGRILGNAHKDEMAFVI